MDYLLPQLTRVAVTWLLKIRIVATKQPMITDNFEQLEDTFKVTFQVKCAYLI